MRNDVDITRDSRSARNRKRAVAPACAAVSALSLLVAACGSSSTKSGASAGNASSPTSASGAAAKSTSGTRIGLVTINETAAFFTEMIKGAQAEAAKKGVTLYVNNPDNSVSKQNTAVQDYANEHLNAVIVDAIDGDSVDSALTYARSHGTNVVAVDSILNSPAVQSQIGVSNEQAGKQLGDYFNTWAKTHLPGGVGKIGVVGALNSPIQVQRQNGFVNAVKAAGSTIIQVVNGQNVESTAQTAAQDLVTAQPGMTAVYDTGEPANLGAISAIKQAGRAGKLPLFGWDLDSTGIDAIKSGLEIAAIQQDPYQEGVQAVDAAVALSTGQAATRNITAPANVITKANVGSVKPY